MKNRPLRRSENANPVAKRKDQAISCRSEKRLTWESPKVPSVGPIEIGLAFHPQSSLGRTRECAVLLPSETLPRTLCPGNASPRFQKTRRGCFPAAMRPVVAAKNQECWGPAPGGPIRLGAALRKHSLPQAESDAASPQCSRRPCSPPTLDSARFFFSVSCCRAALRQSPASTPSRRDS